MKNMAVFHKVLQCGKKMNCCYKLLGILILFLLCLWWLLVPSKVECCTKIQHPKPSVQIKDNSFYLDGKPLRILSGSFHYFQTLPEQWIDRFKRIKAAGLNTVTTMIPWNLHEKRKNEYNFKGRYNISKFIELAQEVGLFVIVQTGPYIGPDWEFGGFPSWLLNDEDMVFRSSAYRKYLWSVESYYSVLLPMLAPHTYMKGGAIIAFQIEHQFGKLTTNDEAYLAYLVYLHRKAKLFEMMISSDDPDEVVFSSVPGIVPTLLYEKNTLVNLQDIKAKSDELPLFVSGYWIGSHDTQGKRVEHSRNIGWQNRLKELLKTKISINFNMFVGGNNFGFYDDKKSDLHAAVLQSGDITETYKVIQRLVFSETISNYSPKLPSNSEKRDYGKVKIQSCLSFEDMISIISQRVGRIVLNNTNTMEMMDINNMGGQGYGYLLYRLKFKKAAILKIDKVKDRALIFINGKYFTKIEGLTENNVKFLKLDTSLLNEYGINVLDILVENTGRLNYGTDKLLKTELKGIIGNVKLDGKIVTHIEHIPFEFSEEFIEDVGYSKQWVTINSIDNYKNIPTLFKGSFQIKGVPKDTYLDLSNWVKGIVFINGVHMGKYMKTKAYHGNIVYIPYPILKEGENEVMLFEEQNPNEYVKFVDNNTLLASHLESDN